MAEDSFKNILTFLILFVGFTWLILTITIDFGAEYGVSADQIGGGALDVDDFRTTAGGVESSAQQYRSRFESGKVDDIDDASGIFRVATDMISLITTPFTLLSQILTNIFGIPTLIINIILGLLAISMIFGIWRLLRSGS